jgi:hypothetical protein
MIYKVESWWPAEPPSRGRCIPVFTIGKIIGLALLTGIASSASAESVSVMENQYQPLVSTKQGRIETCGYGFNTAVRTVNGRIFFVTGSANMSYPKGRLPLTVIKVRVFQIVQNKPVPRQVNFAMLRHGNNDTSKMRSTRGEDGYSVLYGANVSEDPFYMELPLHFAEGLWVSFNVAPGGSEFVFRLPAMAGNPKDMETFQQVAECDMVGIDTVRKDFEKATDPAHGRPSQ